MACECSDEYGPCEDHAELLVLREGASTRTADALALVFLFDTAGLLRDAGDESRADAADATARRFLDCSWSNHAGDGWLDDADDADELQHAVTIAESWLPDGLLALWDDGYRVVRVAADCPLLDAR